jgi:hypothetical protein
MMPCSAAPFDELPLIPRKHDVGALAGLYARCPDYFLVEDGEPATLADATELFHDVPEEKSAADQTVLGWQGDSVRLGLSFSAIIRVRASGILAL